MKKGMILHLLGVILFFLIHPLHAGIPLWTFLPLTATTVSVSSSSEATIQYLITNQSRKTHTLVMTPIPGITQVTSAGNCPLVFTLGYQQSCTLTLLISGSTLGRAIHGGPIVCQYGSSSPCYQPAAANVLSITPSAGPGATLISESVSTLALKVSGTARIITITNNGSSEAVNVNFTSSTPLPTGTTVTRTNCDSVAPSATCTFTITPGAVPSAAQGDTNPTPITLSISGDNTNTLTATINILDYASVYQSGYIFSIDDTTPNTGSIGGTVAALTDQSTLVVWSSNGAGPTTPIYNDINGIYETSRVSTGDPCDGNTQGSCNTNVIITYYDTNFPGIPYEYYAAGLCKATIDGYSDWYLPSACEMSYGTTPPGTDAGCGDQANPTLQSMQANLLDNGDFGNLNGNNYWSSTEWSGSPSSDAFYQHFSFPLGALQDTTNKGSTIFVRCVRHLT